MAFSDIAYKALQDIVGKENVTNDPLMCQAYSRIQWTPDGVIQREQIGLAMRPAYDLLGPRFFNVHLIVKEIKKTFDPNNISNPPYPTRPDVVPPQELAEMTKVL